MNYYNMKFLLTIIFVALLSEVYGQKNISGFVIDQATRNPIPYVTVYISGTTIGTITNEKGEFILEKVSNSSLIVFSHVSYITKTILMNESTLSELKLSLQLRTLDLKEIKVEEKSLRNKNIDLFKKNFFGNDSWGSNIVFLNDSALKFEHIYNYKKVAINDSVKNEIKRGFIKNIDQWDKDSLYIIIKELTEFKVKANAPLNIRMPLLGYQLQVDLIDFKIKYINQYQQCETLGYYYFQPYILDNDHKAKYVEKSRQRAYYNSSQHFIRSLFNKELAQNGYAIMEKNVATKNNKNIFTSVSIDSCLKEVNHDQIQIVGLKDKKLYIFYYSKVSGEPIDLTVQKPSKYYKVSEIYFLDDNCLINRTGTIPNNSIMFSGDISMKKIGSLLPEEYNIVSQQSN